MVIAYGTYEAYFIISVWGDHNVRFPLSYNYFSQSRNHYVDTGGVTTSVTQHEN